MPPASTEEAEKCPVDHQTREKWLAAAKSKQQDQASRYQPPTNHDRIKQQPHQPARFSLDTGSWQPLTNPNPTLPPAKRLRQTLPTDREISTIPRALTPTNPSTLNSAEAAALPSNAERDTGHDTASGNWIYPSQSMFFAAMRRKGHDPDAADMSTIVPIHNAVNERAWAEIKTWEQPYKTQQCEGPKLVSFAGDSKALTPRARWRTWVMGYKEPFDRHDWVVERCGGGRVEYVIDFYEGKKDTGGGREKMPVSFFLDVRPKLNSWVGIRTRVGRAVGI